MKHEHDAAMIDRIPGYSRQGGSGTVEQSMVIVSSYLLSVNFIGVVTVRLLTALRPNSQPNQI
jgi:hypothetical protein